MFSGADTRANPTLDPSSPGTGPDVGMADWVRDDATDLALFHRALAGLCRAEVPLGDAFRLLARDLEHGPLGAAAARLSVRVADGEPLDRALAAEGDTFPRLHRALIEAGIASGDLATALEAVARQAAREQQIRVRVDAVLRTAATTTILVLGLGLVAVVAAGPGMLELAVEASRFGAPAAGASIELGLMVAVGALAVAALGFAAVSVPLWFARCRAGAAGPWRYRIPVLGGLLRLGATSAALSGLGLLLLRRVPLATALDLVAASAEVTLRAPLLGAADFAHDGASVAESLDDANVLPPSCLWLIEAAERRGEAAQALLDVSDLLHDRLERSIDRCLELFAPAVTLLVGAVVLALAYAFLIGPIEAMRRLIG